MSFTERNKGIDLIRALTMFFMVTVNYLWAVDDVPHFLVHAKVGEDFMGFSDFIFPCFLYVIGLSIPYAIESRFAKGHDGLSTLWHVLSRSAALLVMGAFYVNMESGIASMNPSRYMLLMVVGFFLVWNNYPKDMAKWLRSALKAAGAALLISLAVLYRDPSGRVFQARWWGILGLLGWAYFMTAMLYLAFRSNLWKQLAAWVVFVAISIVEAQHLFPSQSLPETVLRLFTIQPGTRVAWCLGGVLTSIVAVRVAEWKPSRKALLACGVVAALMAVAFILHNFWPWSKNAETPPTLFLCTAVSLALYCVLSWVASKGGDRYFKPIKAAGTATLTCYMMPLAIQAVLGLFGVGMRLPLSGYAGVAACMAFSFICVFCTAGLEKLGVKLKI